MKKSLFTLFASLIVCGLLFLGSADALKYTVSGNMTTVKIPQSPTDGEMEIDWGDETATRITSCTSENLADGARGYKCNHVYNDNQLRHTITIKNPNSQDVESLYISEGNVISIENFDGFLKITQLYISNNEISTLPQNIFTSFSNDVYIHANENLLTDFQPDLNKIKNLYLNDNKLTTIPQNIWNARGTHKIHLTNNIKIGNNTRGNVYLNNETVGEPDNEINFVGITKIDNTDDIRYIDGSLTYKFLGVPNNGYYFERFGYSYNTESIIYKYQILKGNVSVNEGTNNSTGAIITQKLAPGNYTFKVCYNEENDDNNPEHCDEVDFTVDYDENITISSPQNNQEYDSINNISGERCRAGIYPSEILSGYSYILKKGDQVIESKSIPFNDNYNYCEEIDIDNIITNYLLGNDPNDTYTLTVYLEDNERNHAQRLNSEYIYATHSFRINIPDEPATITISKPDNVASTQTVEFEWNGSFPSSSSHTYYLDHYEYSVTGAHSYSTGGNINNTSFQLQDLSDGAYTFTVTMYYTDNGEQKSVTSTKDFSMSASESPNLSITSPINLAHITGANATEINIPFTWNGGATLFHKYHYTLKDSSNHELTGGNITINDANHRQFSYNLGNGTYTFEVKMYNSSNVELKSDSSTFTVNIPTTLNIISPTSGNHSSATTTFSWEGFTPYTFTNYEYSVTGPNGFSIGPTTTGSTSFSLQNLHDGSYTFSLTMNYKEGSTPKTITKTRSFTINSSAGANIEITSPNKPTYTGNYFKTVPMNFTWNGGGSTLISRYSYKLTNTATSEIKAQGYIDKNSGGSYTIPVSPLSLPSGTYKFEVTMLDSEDNPIIPTESYTFNIIIPSYLEILSPSSGQLNTKNVNFTWSGFAEFEDHYKYEVNRVDNQGNVISTIESGNNVPLSTKSFSLQNLHNGKYTFTVSIMDGDDFEIISGSRTFRIPDDLDLILDISDGNSSETTLRSRKGIFSRGGKSEDFAGYSYSIQGTTFKNESYLYTGTSEGITTGSITLNNLSTGKYRFYVKMLNASGGIITGKYIDFDVVIPATLKIISPVSGSTLNSSNVTFKWDGYSDVITRYEYSLISSGGYNYNGFTTVDSFTRNDLVNGDYTLVVRLASGTNFVAEDTIHFTVDIPKKTSGGGGGSSSKSHPTNDLSVSIANESPNTNERIEVKVDVKDKYTGKVDFSKMQYYSGGEWIDIPVTSKNYVSDYSDDAKLGYVNFSSSDNGEKELSEFLKISKKGNYRIYAEDKDGYIDYVQFYVGNGGYKSVVKVESNPVDTDDEVYIARSCKKYKIIYSDSLNVYTSPNLNMNEYFMNKDYFKRYIDSKNRYKDGCPTNVGWISTNYSDKTNDDTRYTAPNGKVYFITGKGGNYYSNELNRELKTPASFNTIQQLKYYIRDRNPLINMATLGPVK